MFAYPVQTAIFVKVVVCVCVCVHACSSSLTVGTVNSVEVLVCVCACLFIQFDCWNSHFCRGTGVYVCMLVHPV